AALSVSTRFDPLLADAGLFQEELTLVRKQRQQRAEEALRAFVGEWNGLVRPLVVEGPPVESLGEVVRRRSADLLTVASRGSSPSSMARLGSVAEGALAGAPCDVAIARVDRPFRRP
ncbi:MAG: universal stress protein, partial [Acidimicrobiia bacterium]